MPCFILFSRYIISLTIKFVSSANKISFKTGDIFGRSFIYIIKTKLDPIQILVQHSTFNLS